MASLLAPKKFTEFMHPFIKRMLIIVALLQANALMAQCTFLAKEDGLENLDTSLYVHDGRFNAFPIAEGEEIDLIKPFFEGQQYRVAIACSNIFPSMTYRILDLKGNILLEEEADGYTAHFDVLPQISENLLISVKLPQQNNTAVKGCLAIVVGMKKDE